jgi:methylenetetrahydrofolate reductase (NADPH)
MNIHANTIATPGGDPTRSIAADLVVSGSLEIGAHRPQDAVAVASLLPAGTPVYVNHLPRHSLADTLAGLIAVRRAGLEPVPHVAARRIVSQEEAERFLEWASGEAGVRKVLVIGGDTASSAGPYADALQFLKTGLLRRYGIREAGLAAYPEGHPRIAKPQLAAALAEKIETLTEQGLGAFAVTQFTFQPSRIVELCADLHRRHPGLPVYTGLPGPTTLTKLIQLAQKCGVGASLRALQGHGLGAANLITRTDPTDQLLAIAGHCATRTCPNIVGVHVFTFGGVEPSALFMNRWITRQGAAGAG